MLDHLSSPYRKNPSYKQARPEDGQPPQQRFLRSERPLEQERRLFFLREARIREAIGALLELPHLPINARGLLQVLRSNPLDAAPLFSTSVRDLGYNNIQTDPEEMRRLISQLEDADPANAEDTRRLWHRLVEDCALLQEARDYLVQKRRTPQESKVPNPIPHTEKPPVSSGVQRRQQAPYHREVMPWDAYATPGESIDLDLGIG